MDDLDTAAARASDAVRALIGSPVAHARSDRAVRFSFPQGLTRDGRTVAVPGVVAAIEAQGLQTIRTHVPPGGGPARIDAVGADVETFAVDRHGMTKDGRAVMTVMHVGRIVEFDADAAYDPRHLALTRTGDMVRIMRAHRHDRITAFRNLSLEGAVAE